METQPPTKKRRRRDQPMPNPYRDKLSQEIAYKIDGRTAGCLVFLLIAGLFLIAGLSFLAYWLTH
jgi:hypothetical protein